VVPKPVPVNVACVATEPLVCEMLLSTGVITVKW
jgi:hypothetical protein